MAKRMRNPNGYGSITKLSGNRRNPYMVKVNTHMDERYYPVYDILGYYPTWADASIALAKYNDDPYDISAAHMTFAQLYKYYYDDKYVYASKSCPKVLCIARRWHTGTVHHCITKYILLFEQYTSSEFWIPAKTKTENLLAIPFKSISSI